MSGEETESDVTGTSQKELDVTTSSQVIPRLVLEEILENVTHLVENEEITHENIAKEEIHIREEDKRAKSDQNVTEWMLSLIPNVEDILPEPPLPSTNDVLRGPSGDAPDTFRDQEINADNASGQETPMMIEADNPLMVRFQKVLRNHLESQYAKLKDEVVIMEGEVKKKEDEKRVLGEQIYNEERDLQAQKEAIAKYENELALVTEQRALIEKHLKKQMDVENVVHEDYSDRGKEDEFLRKNLEDLSEFVRLLTECKKRQDGQMKNIQALGHKNKIEKNILFEEKQKQDVFLWRLTKENFRLKRQYDNLVDIVKEKQKKIDQMKVVVAEADIDLANLVKENSKIRLNVNQTFSTLKERNGLLLDSKEEYKVAVNQMRLMDNIIRSYQKATDKEIETEKRLAQAKETYMGKIDGMKNEISNMKTQINTFVNSLSGFTRVSEETSKDLVESKKVYKGLEAHLLAVQKLTSELMSKRKIIEDKLYSKIKDISLNDKVFKHIDKLIKQQGMENSQQGYDLSSTGYDVAALLARVEEKRLNCQKRKMLLEEIKAFNIDKRNDVKNLKEELKLKTEIFVKNTRYFKEGKIKLAAIKHEQETDLKAASPLKKLDMAKEALKEVEKELDVVVDQWLEMQNRILEMKEQRGQQVLRLNVTRKHVLVMSDSNIKIRSKIAGLEKNIIKNQREIKRVQQKISLIDEKTFHQKEYEKQLKGMSYDAETKYIQILQEAEAASIQHQNEICELELSIEELKEGLEEAQTEVLAWEKKFKLAMETKTKIEEEKASTGEVGMLKLHNHRLEVKLSQLKKVEEKLLGDLEMCVTKRGMIIDQAEAREKRSAVGKLMTNNKLKQKLADIRAKCKQGKQKVQSAEKELIRLRQKEVDLEKREQLLNCQVNNMDRVVEELRDRLHNLGLLKVELFNMIVWKQKTEKYLQLLNKGTYRLIYKTEEAIESEEAAQREIQESLEFVMNKIMCEIPRLELPLLHIMVTIKQVIYDPPNSPPGTEQDLYSMRNEKFKGPYCDLDESSDSSFGCKCKT